MGIFREYDIRGVVKKDLTPDVVKKIGHAYATFARERGVKRITVGRDGRLTSPTLRDALVAGLTGAGIDVVDLGLCATPLLYFSLFHMEVDGGIMITGSHNAAEYNGFKMCVGQEALYGADIQRIREIFDNEQFSSGQGTVVEQPIISEYLAFLQERFSSVKADGLRVVIDCGNGAASLVAKDALEQLGCQVTGLYCELDGGFPTNHPDPTVVENLADLVAKVKATKAHVGMGYDGDADRIGVIDEQGGILWGDRLLLLFARDVLEEHPGSTFISEVKASQVFYEDIPKHGGRAIMWKTGHSLIKAKMKEEKAMLAGEMSGHVFFADRYYGYDDAIYASCRLVEILVKREKPLSSLLSDVPQTVVTPEIRVDCSDDQKFQLVEAVTQRFQEIEKTQDLDTAALPIRELITIDGIRVRFDNGWGLIRASNTQPALVLRFEAWSSDQLSQIREYLESELANAKQALTT